MEKKECPSCWVDIEAEADVCPICGYEFPKNKPWVMWVALALLVLIGYIAIRLIMNYL